MALLVLVFSACSKTNDPAPSATKISSGGTTVTTGSTSNITKDDSIHMAAFHVATQIVTTSVTGNTLYMVFNENVNLLYPADGYKKIAAIHLTEDFSKTMLANFDFTAVNEDGSTTLNWRDDNLNNVPTKTATDTVINKVSMVKVNVHRTITFFKAYDSATTATTEQGILLKSTGDVVNFSSYSYYNQVNYPATATSSKIDYIK